MFVHCLRGLDDRGQEDSISLKLLPEPDEIHILEQDACFVADHEGFKLGRVHFKILNILDIQGFDVAAFVGVNLL